MDLGSWGSRSRFFLDAEKTMGTMDLGLLMVDLILLMVDLGLLIADLVLLMANSGFVCVFFFCP